MAKMTKDGSNGSDGKKAKITENGKDGKKYQIRTKIENWQKW